MTTIISLASAMRSRTESGHKRPIPALLSHPLRTDLEFLPAALEVVETPPSPRRLALIGVICGTLFCTIAWMCFAHIEIHAVAQGKVQPAGLSKVVQASEAGRVLAIRVENGAAVKAGDVLLELDPTEAIADRTVQAHDLSSAAAEVEARTRALDWARQEGRASDTKAPTIVAGADTGPEHELLMTEIAKHSAALESLHSQVAEGEARRARLQASISARTNLLAILKERVDTRQYLDGKGLGYRAKVLDALQEFERENTQLVAEQGQLVEAEASLASLAVKRQETVAQFIAEQSRSRLEAMRKRDRFAQELLKAEVRKERTILRAPTEGTVQQLSATTIGQVVKPGQPLVTVVPRDAKLEIEALVANKDIGFIELGQRTIIKVDAFPFTRFGTLSGRLIKISRDAVDERASAASADAVTAQQISPSDTRFSGTRTLVFPVTIALERKHIQAGKDEIPLVPGMAVTAEITTGDRRAIDYLLSPLREFTATVGHER